MAEVLVSFDQPVRDELGEYHARRSAGRLTTECGRDGSSSGRSMADSEVLVTALKRASRNTNILSIGRPD